ncbi:MAG: penicillin-binding protein 1C [Chitinophagaceae bacterium]|nr:penicillin-binding protein 1C [Chitinophagaceae bacterium]
MKRFSFNIFSKKNFKRSGLALLCLVLLFLLLHLLFPLPDTIEYSTIITDSKGEVIHAFLTKDEQWRMKTDLSEISPLLRKTIVQKEDKYFYYHFGINPIAVARAFFMNVFTGRRTSGASTITMQVARALEPKQRNVMGKLKEMFRATQLEIKYSKDEILQLYLNLVPYGGNIEGVKSASILYFGKNPDHLSLAEITALSIIPNRPSSLVIGKNNDEIVKQRNKWLNRFAKEKIFTQKEIEDALAEPLNAKRGVVPKLAPHLATKLKQSGEVIIKTTLQINTQLKTEKLVQDYVRTLRLSNIRNAAVMIVDNETHKVIAYVGSGDFKDTTDGGQVNGTAAVRQPGSTLKPLVYALCFDEGLLTPKKMMNDVPVNYAGYAPENYDKNFNGPVTVEYALEHSLNIPAVKALNMLGKEKMIAQLSSMGFTQIQNKQKGLGLSMILGGCGTTLEQLTNLYSCFANEGLFYRSAFVQADSAKQAKRMISADAAYMVNDILSRINRPDFPLHWEATAHLPKIAWKTGTSYGRRDAWSIGYNKKYTVGVWVGNFSGEGNTGLSGAHTATPLLFRIFNTLDYDADRAWFTTPADLEQRQVCSETGLPPAANCTNLILDYFIPGISSTQTCNNYEEIAVSADEKISYCKSCEPATGFKRKVYKLIAPELQNWMQANGIAFEPIPAHNPNCEKIFTNGAPQIKSPVNGTEYLISKKHPEPLQLVCETGNDVSRVYWYINNQFYKAADAGSKQFFIPAEGSIKISCTDDKGRNRNVKIVVRMVDL